MPRQEHWYSRKKDWLCCRELGLWVSCFEIYGGKLYDLLNSRHHLVMREDGKGRVCIVGLKEARAHAALRSMVAAFTGPAACMLHRCMQEGLERCHGLICMPWGTCLMRARQH